jgi:hypothetical protein
MLLDATAYFSVAWCDLQHSLAVCVISNLRHKLAFAVAVNFAPAVNMKFKLEGLCLLAKF